MKEIYNPICYSLYTDDIKDEKCLKRCFHAYDFINDDTIKILVCSEYFRLTFNKYQNYDIHPNYSWESRRALRKTLNETIGKYVPLWISYENDYEAMKARNSMFCSYKKSFESLSLDLDILTRPNMSSSYHLYDVFQIILNNPTKCRTLKADLINLLMRWSKGKTLKKDNKQLSLIREAFSINGNRRSGHDKYYYSDIGYDINEIALIDLVTHLFNKLK